MIIFWLYSSSNSLMLKHSALLIGETDLLAKGFLLPTLSTSILVICFWIDLVRVLVTTKNTSPVAGYARV